MYRLPLLCQGFIKTGSYDPLNAFHQLLCFPPQPVIFGNRMFSRSWQHRRTGLRASSGGRWQGHPSVPCQAPASWTLRKVAVQRVCEAILASAVLPTSSRRYVSGSYYLSGLAPPRGSAFSYTGCSREEWTSRKGGVCPIPRVKEAGGELGLLMLLLTPRPL